VVRAVTVALQVMAGPVELLVWAVTVALQVMAGPVELLVWAVTVALQVMAGPVELLVWAVTAGAAASLHWTAVTECVTPSRPATTGTVPTTTAALLIAR